MSIQGQFNEDAIAQLALVKAFIDKAEEFEANQMRVSTLQKLSNCKPSVSEMTPSQVNDLEDELINKFTHNGWVRKGYESGEEKKVLGYELNDDVEGDE